MILPMQARLLIPHDGIVAKNEVVFDRDAGAAGGMKTITSRHF